MFLTNLLLCLFVGLLCGCDATSYPKLCNVPESANLPSQAEIDSRIKQLQLAREEFDATKS